MPWTSQYTKWLVDTSERLKTVDGKCNRGSDHVFLTSHYLCDMLNLNEKHGLPPITRDSLKLHSIIQNIYREGEPHQEATHKKFLSVCREVVRQVQRNLGPQSAPICAIRG